MKRTGERRQGAVGSVAKWNPMPTVLPCGLADPAGLAFPVYCRETRGLDFYVKHPM